MSYLNKNGKIIFTNLININIEDIILTATPEISGKRYKIENNSNKCLLYN